MIENWNNFFIRSSVSLYYWLKSVLHTRPFCTRAFCTYKSSLIPFLKNKMQFWNNHHQQHPKITNISKMFVTNTRCFNVFFKINPSVLIHNSFFFPSLSFFPFLTTCIQFQKDFFKWYNVPNYFLCVNNPFFHVYWFEFWKPILIRFLLFFILVTTAESIHLVVVFPLSTKDDEQ